ncbi:MAG: D-alanyl-D-alanine carboxypeptidase [Clostridiaceae bacterium]|jgi:D-alanyl-D-alanine carboxypeptidase|nr:D-alanyl-D-alanine carboxypeptidase [Clostridiaceae bacterium]
MNDRDRRILNRCTIRRLLFCLLLLFLIGLFVAPTEVRAFDAYGWPSFEEIQVKSYIVIDAETGETILSKNAESRLPVASTTKLMTALLLLEDPAFDPERLLVVSKESKRFPCSGAVCMPLIAGEHIRTVDCLAAMLIRSANDMANVIAENYGGAFGAIDPDNLNDPLESRRRFMERMNKRLGELGAHNTHFTNPAGFDDDDHYSTASDLTIIMREIMKYPLFNRISGIRLYMMPPTDAHSSVMWAPLNTTNGLIYYGAKGLSSRYFKEYNSGKTGSTIGAGYCLVASGTTHDDRVLIAVALGLKPITADTSFGRALPVRALLEEAASRIGVPEIDPLTTRLADPTPEETESTALVTEVTETHVETNVSKNEEIWILKPSQEEQPTISGWSAVQKVVIVLGAILVLMLAFLAGWFFSYRYERKSRRD